MTAQPSWQHVSANESALLLDAIDSGQRPPCTTADLEAVRCDALRAIALLPDPREIAEGLETGEPCLAETLRRAYLGQRQPNAGWWRIEEGSHTGALRRMGLVEVGDYGLTAHGNTVRKHLVGQAS